MAPIPAFYKLYLLVWKNFKLQFSNKIRAAMELIFPVFVIMVVLIFRVSTSIKLPPIRTEPVGINDLSLLRSYVKQELKFGLLYSPKTYVLDEIVEKAAGFLEIQYESIDTEAILVEEMEHQKHFAGIVFEGSATKATHVANITTFEFKLRFPAALRTGFNQYWQTNSIYSKEVAPRNERQDKDGPPSYTMEGFLSLQNALSKAFLELKFVDILSEQSIPDIMAQRFPYPKSIKDEFKTMVSELCPVIIVLSFIYPVVCLAHRVTFEKENGLKDVMQIAGLSNWLHWMAWFVQSFICLGLEALLICIIMVLFVINERAVLNSVSFSVMLIVLLLYICTLILFSFLISSIFRRASSAALFSGFIMFSTILAYYIFTLLLDSAAIKIISCFILNLDMAISFNIISIYEKREYTLDLSTVFNSLPDAEVSVGTIFIIMIIKCAIYLLLTLYLEQLGPSQSGVSQRWNFPFQKTFWTCNRGLVSDSKDRLSILSPFEQEVRDCCVMVKADKLRKVFGNKEAVQNVTMEIFEDEILVLLGRNGAGKSTTISMLTGMLPPTFGSIFINNLHLYENLDEARLLIGFCPQYNTLFDDMTVEDHLVFFSRVKGLNKAGAKTEAIKYMDLIEIRDKAKTKPKNLSLGMQRKLSLCCALCGGSKIIFFDEPSSGLDPVTRRQLWSLIKQVKAGRTIFLTTQFMDEADALGDRVAIMFDGEIKANGTPFYLKKAFGSGYKLTCVKEEGCDPQNVTALLIKYVPNIKPSSDIGSELSYQLPEQYSSKFEAMFMDLENNFNTLKIEGFGLGLATMEEVFMNVAEYSAKTKSDTIPNSEIISLSESLSRLSFFDDPPKAREERIPKYSFQAMFYKKCLLMRRNWMMVVAFLVFMPLFICSANILFYTDVSTLGPHLIDPSSYREAISILDSSNVPAAGTLLANAYKEYENLDSSHPIKVLETNGTAFTEYILEKSNTPAKQTRINSAYLTAADFGPNTIAWFNNEFFHSAPLSLNLIYIAIYRALANDHKANIVVTNHPLPRSVEAIGKNLPTHDSLTFSFTICFIMCFVTAYYIFLPIRERITRTKQLQYVSGVTAWTYWFASFVFDYATFLLVSFVVVASITALAESGYTTFLDIGRVYFLVAVFGVAAITMAYVFSFCIDDPRTGLSYLVSINVLLGSGSAFLILELERNFIKWFLLFLPHVPLTLGLNKLALQMEKHESCTKLPPWHRCIQAPACCDPWPYFTFQESGILVELLYLLFTTVVNLILLVLIDGGFFRIFRSWYERIGVKKPASNYRSLDDDVRKEYDKVNQMPDDEILVHNLVLHKLTKCYKKNAAVNQISLCVERNMCFGMLGVDGAGKTSTIRMLTGEHTITFGEASIGGVRIKTGRRKLRYRIGYCPQRDALFEELTGQEQMRLFCLIRGIQEDHIGRTSVDLAKRFGFYDGFHDKINTYSRENKRKVSVAIASVGEPNIIFLDEPSSGVDPVSRRRIWDVLCDLHDSGNTIILSSNSMEECEALCSRIVIMVNGVLKCIGSAQQLKNKFSKGVILKIKAKRLERNDTRTKEQKKKYLRKTLADIKSFVLQHFPSASFQEEFQGILTYHINMRGQRWSNIFGVIEGNTEQLNIEDYSVSQISLEEAFLDFVSDQRIDTRPYK